MSNEEYDRITIIEDIHYRPYNSEGFSVGARFSIPIDDDEQPYIRQNHKGTKATEEWAKIDTGWFDSNYKMIVITNDEGKGWEYNPTEEELEEVKKKILEVKLSDVDDTAWIIYPEDCFRGCPNKPTNIWIRCQSGEAKYTITILPK